MALCLVTLTDL